MYHINRYLKINKYDIENMKKLCKNRWPQIITSKAPELKEAIEKRPAHCKCPVHGGVDGLRAFNDFDETGGMVCNTCGFFHDGIETLIWIKNWNFRITIEEIFSFLKAHESITDHS